MKPGFWTVILALALGAACRHPRRLDDKPVAPTLPSAVPLTLPVLPAATPVVVPLTKEQLAQALAQKRLLVDGYIKELNYIKQWVVALKDKRAKVVLEEAAKKDPLAAEILAVKTVAELKLRLDSVTAKVKAYREADLEAQGKLVKQMSTEISQQKNKIDSAMKNAEGLLKKQGDEEKRKVQAEAAKAAKAAKEAEKMKKLMELSKGAQQATVKGATPTAGAAASKKEDKFMDFFGGMDVFGRPKRGPRKVGVPQKPATVATPTATQLVGAVSTPAAPAVQVVDPATKPVAAAVPLVGTTTQASPVQAVPATSVENVTRVVSQEPALVVAPKDVVATTTTATPTVTKGPVTISFAHGGLLEADLLTNPKSNLSTIADTAVRALSGRTAVKRPHKIAVACDDHSYDRGVQLNAKDLARDDEKIVKKQAKKFAKNEAKIAKSLDEPVAVGNGNQVRAELHRFEEQSQREVARQNGVNRLGRFQDRDAEAAVKKTEKLARNGALQKELNVIDRQAKNDAKAQESWNKNRLDARYAQEEAFDANREVDGQRDFKKLSGAINKELQHAGSQAAKEAAKKVHFAAPAKTAAKAKRFVRRPRVGAVAEDEDN